MLLTSDETCLLFAFQGFRWQCRPAAEQSSTKPRSVGQSGCAGGLVTDRSVLRSHYCHNRSVVRSHITVTMGQKSGHTDLVTDISVVRSHIIVTDRSVVRSHVIVLVGVWSYRSCHRHVSSHFTHYYHNRSESSHTGIVTGQQSGHTLLSWQVRSQVIQVTFQARQ